LGSGSGNGDGGAGLVVRVIDGGGNEGTAEALEVRRGVSGEGGHFSLSFFKWWEDKQQVNRES